jgi:uncharacterized paraquat-inducible protein A
MAESLDEQVARLRCERAARPWHHVQCDACTATGPWMHVDPVAGWITCPRCSEKLASFSRELDDAPIFWTSDP